MIDVVLCPECKSNRLDFAYDGKCRDENRYFICMDCKFKFKNPDHQEAGLKLDKGKQPWFAMPLEVLEPLADVYAAGEKKYATFNCLNPFEDGDRRFWDAIMRHLKECQRNPLARDEETGCYHLAQVCFNALHRLHDARQREKKENNWKEKK